MKWFIVFFSTEDFHRSTKCYPTAMGSLEIKGINVMFVGDFFAVTKNALPPQEARILSFESLE